MAAPSDRKIKKEGEFQVSKLRGIETHAPGLAHFFPISLIGEVIEIGDVGEKNSLVAKNKLEY